MRAAALVLICVSLPGLDWSAYDKQLHAASGALGAYILCDVLERRGWSPWQRWLASVGVMTAAAWAYEELNGSSGAYREANDAHAGTIGAVFGAGAQLGVSFVLTPDRSAVGVAWSW